MIDDCDGNISYILNEQCKEENNNLTYEDLLNEVTKTADAIPDEDEFVYDDYGESILDMDDYIALELDYQTNYIKKDLDKIADYYEISKRKKRKMELIEDIVLFEKDPSNIEKVMQRKKMWMYFEEIKKDKYLRQFLILD